MIRRDYAPGRGLKNVEAARQTGDTRLADITSTYADVGARYALALFELAEQDGSIAAVESDLKGFEQLRAENADFARMLTSPTYSHEDKGRALVAVAEAGKADALTRKFLGLLAANNRVAALPAVARAFRKLVADKRGLVAAEVVSAAPLSDAQSSAIAAALRQALGKDPEITTRVDPSILGGLRVKVGSRLFDSSLRTRLDHMKFALKRA
jgi:F-type H+-transporting ATPase subunit delta